MTPTDCPANPNQSAANKQNTQNGDFLTPKSVAVIGASREIDKIGSQILQNIIKGGFQGKIYPINPKADNIQDLQTYPSVKNVPDSIDMALVAIPAKYVPQVIKECGEKQIKTCVIISAGFKEAGKEGEKLEDEIKSIAKEFKINIIGPNCLGFMNTDICLNATFAATTAKKGKIVLFSQSGAFGTAILDWSNDVNIGFKYFISIGNKATVDETFLLEHFVEKFHESNENLIFAGYIEDIHQGRKFMELASKLSSKHPFIVLKPGRSEEAQKAVSSHTGSLATQDSIIEAALQQSGCLRVTTIEDMFNSMQILARQSAPRGNRVAIVTNAGGPGIAATDMIENSKLDMTTLSETTQYHLKEKLPPAASVSNPVDVMGDALADRYETALEAVLVDENVDSVLVLLTPQAITEVEKTAAVIAEKSDKYPSKTVITSFIGGEITKKGIKVLNQYQMPIFTYPGDAINALENAYEYRQIMNEPNFKTAKVSPKAKTLEPGTNLVGKRAEEFVTKYEIKAAPCVSVDAKEETPHVIDHGMEFPVAAKITSPLLIHKTEMNAVKLNIKNQQELNNAVIDLKKAWEQKFSGEHNYEIQIQKQVTGGENLILGFKRDPHFGPVILFGAGGIFTEVFHDVSERIAPIHKAEAYDMIMQTRISKILEGYRGSKPRDMEFLIDTILKVSDLALAHPEINEFDINPLIILNEGEGGYAVDVKIIT